MARVGLFLFVCFHQCSKAVYSCFDKGCPKKRKSVRDNAER